MPGDSMPHQLQLDNLQRALDAVRAEPLGTNTFVRLARCQPELAAALPPRFGQVLEPLLDRLESSALFTEESCSFSQKDLLDSLQVWLDKAKQAVNTV